MTAARVLGAEAGAVTSDWVALTAGLVGLGLAVAGIVRGGVSDVSSEIGDQLASEVVYMTFDGRERDALVEALAARWGNPIGRAIRDGGTSAPGETRAMAAALADAWRDRYMAEWTEPQMRAEIAYLARWREGVPSRDATLRQAMAAHDPANPDWTAFAGVLERRDRTDAQQLAHVGHALAAGGIENLPGYADALDDVMAQREALATHLLARRD